MIANELISAFTGAIENHVAVYPYGDGQLVDLPWSFGDSEGMSVLITPVGEGLYNLSDRGLAASNLALAGVDLSAGKNRRSWDAVRGTLGLPGPIGRTVSEFEIAALVDDAQIGQALHDMGAVMLRADGLRGLGTPGRRQSFSDRLVRSAQAEGADVIPLAPLRMKYGGKRKVTAQLLGQREVYMQGLGSDDTYDHARSLLGDAELRPDQAVAVIARGVDVADWKRQALGEHADVIDEAELPEYIRDHVLAAA